MKSDFLMIGEITKPQGVKGEIKVRPVTSDPYRFEGMTFVYVQKDGAYQKVGIEVNRVTPDAVFITMDGVNDREQVEKLRGTLLYIDRAHALELSEDETFLVDLIGLKGMDDLGTEIGVLSDVLQPGGNDVYVFKGPRGTVLVPALRSVVKSVDLATGMITLVSARMAEVAVYDDED